MHYFVNGPFSTLTMLPLQLRSKDKDFHTIFAYNLHDSALQSSGKILLVDYKFKILPVNGWMQCQ